MIEYGKENTTYSNEMIEYGKEETAYSNEIKKIKKRELKKIDSMKSLSSFKFEKNTKKIFKNNKIPQTDQTNPSTKNERKNEKLESPTMRKSKEPTNLTKNDFLEDFFKNEQFQTSYEFLLKSDNSSMKQILKQQELISAIGNEFISTAKRIGEN